MKKLDLDLYPDYIPFVVQTSKADGEVINPTVDNLIIYEESGADGTFDNSTIAGSPFDPVQFNAKTGAWGIMIAKAAFTVGKFYIALWEMTVDGKASAKIEIYIAVDSTSSIESEILTSKNEIIAAVNVTQQDFNVSGD